MGPNRGIEPLVAVLARMHTPCALRLRGLPANGFPDHLRQLARDAGFSGPIEFAELGAPDQMIALAAGADLGLSLEQINPHNRDCCLTNKIFTYLAAGVPVALTPTSAQIALSLELGAAALPLDLLRPLEAAAALDHLLTNPRKLEAARTAAWQAGRTRFHWGYDCPQLLASVAHALLPPHTSSSCV